MPYKNTLEVTCRWELCGKTFMTSPKALARGHGHFCSRQCQGAAGGKRTNELHPQSGEGNHNFRHGDSEHAYRYTRKWYEANKYKVAAQRLVNWLVKRGRIIKPEACEKCGRIARLDGHHDDYRKPAVVRWLCRKCHIAYHEALGAYPKGVGSKPGWAA